MLLCTSSCCFGTIFSAGNYVAAPSGLWTQMPSFATLAMSLFCIAPATLTQQMQSSRNPYAAAATLTQPSRSCFSASHLQPSRSRCLSGFGRHATDYLPIMHSDVEEDKVQGLINAH